MATLFGQLPCRRNVNSRRRNGSSCTSPVPLIGNDDLQLADIWPRFRRVGRAEALGSLFVNRPWPGRAGLVTGPDRAGPLTSRATRDTRATDLQLRYLTARLRNQRHDSAEDVLRCLWTIGDHCSPADHPRCGGSTISARRARVSTVDVYHIKKGKLSYTRLLVIVLEYKWKRNVKKKAVQTSPNN